MGGGNGLKSAMKRDKNAAKAAGAGKQTTAEDRKKHEQAKNSHQCTVCMQGFPRTVRKPELMQHVEKHEKLKKTLAECFPDFVDDQQ